MMGYKSGNSFEMMANNKYSQTKTNNQLRLWTTLNSNTTRGKHSLNEKESNHLGKERTKRTCVECKETQGVDQPCTTESASSIFFTIETSLKPYQKYLGTFERIVWRCDMKYCLACSDAVVLMFKIKQFIVAAGPVKWSNAFLLVPKLRPVVTIY